MHVSRIVWSTKAKKRPALCRPCHQGNRVNNGWEGICSPDILIIGANRKIFNSILCISCYFDKNHSSVTDTSNDTETL